ncbi:transposase [Alicyclobacillus sp. ALC3]|nr:transposase [Alicyclobacillus sp. ALC3]
MESTRTLHHAQSGRSWSSCRTGRSQNTSQQCSNCGEIDPKKLSERIHRCEHCGYRSESAAFDQGTRRGARPRTVAGFHRRRVLGVRLATLWSESLWGSHERGRPTMCWCRCLS